MTSELIPTADDRPREQAGTRQASRTRRGRILVAGFDLFSALCILATDLLLVPTAAYAYVDPSVMTYTIQALAGVAVALSALFGVIWRKTRRKLFKLFGIDENVGKTKEPLIHRINPSTPEGALLLEHADEAARETWGQRSSKKTVPQNLSWKARLGYSFLFVTFLIFTVCVVPPYEIVGSNESSLIFSLQDLWWIIAIAALIAIVVLSFALSAIRGKAFPIVMMVIFSVGVACYLQALVMNVGLPIADGTYVIWDDYTKITLATGAVWCALIAVPLTLSRHNRMRWLKPMFAIGLCLIIVQAVGVGSLFTKSTGQDQTARDKVYVTEEGLYTLAPKNNVIVFVLDTYDTKYLLNILKDDPHFLDSMTDFTFFENSTGSMIPTRYAVPFLLTGIMPQHDETIQAWFARRYTDSTFLDDIRAQNYSIGLYSDTIALNYAPEDTAERIESDTINLHKLDNPDINVLGTLETLEQVALYRDAPWALKSSFWFYTDEMNNMMTNVSSSTDLSNVEYTMDDARFNDELLANGISVEDDGYTGALRFIHLEGAHPPYSLDEHAHVKRKHESTREQQAEGSMRIVLNYIQELKDEGLYDDATIIVTADHGEWYTTMDTITEATSPIMLVKPSKSAADSGKPLTTSDMPISHIDFQPTVIDAVGGDSSKYGSTVWQISDPDRVRYYDMTTHDGVNDHEIREFEIVGNALDFTNWHLTGFTWSWDN